MPLDLETPDLEGRVWSGSPSSSGPTPPPPPEGNYAISAVDGAIATALISGDRATYNPPPEA